MKMDRMVDSMRTGQSKRAMAEEASSEAEQSEFRQQIAVRLEDGHRIELRKQRSREVDTVDGIRDPQGSS